MGPDGGGLLTRNKAPLSYEALAPAMLERLRGAVDVAFLRKVHFTEENLELLQAGLRLPTAVATPSTETITDE